MRVEIYQKASLVVVIEAEPPILKRELSSIILDYIKSGPVEVKLGKAN